MNTETGIKISDPCTAEAEMFLFLLKTPLDPMFNGSNSFLVGTIRDLKKGQCICCQVQTTIFFEMHKDLHKALVIKYTVKICFWKLLIQSMFERFNLFFVATITTKNNVPVVKSRQQKRFEMHKNWHKALVIKYIAMIFLKLLLIQSMFTRSNSFFVAATRDV